MAPIDYYLVFDNSVLTLHFTLPLKTPVKAQSLDLEIYDPNYFVDFSFAEKDPVRWSARRQACKLAVAQARRDAERRPAGRGVLQQSDAVEQFRRAVRQQDRGEVPVTP